MALRTTYITVVSGDSAPDLTIPLTDHDTGAAIDLTTVTSATLKFRKVGSTTLITGSSLTVIAPATQGKLLLQWGTALVGLAAGYYEAQILLTLTGPKTQTISRSLKFKVLEAY